MTDPGRQFDYASAPDIFGTRSGTGPLEIVWDTNILIDYLSYGRQLWDDGEAHVAEPKLAEELAGLQTLIELWLRRDVRFRILPRTLTDARRLLSAERREEREGALQELASALALDGWPEPVAQSLSQDPVAPVLQRIPAGGDRDLVAAALALGAHVYLTRDRKVLTRRDDVFAYGLLLASPIDLLVELGACGALDVLVRPELARWPAPDLQRMTHLIAALPS